MTSAGSDSAARGSAGAEAGERKEPDQEVSVRRLFLSALAVGALTPAAAVALADDNASDASGATTAPATPREAGALRAQASASLHRAVVRAEKKQKHRHGAAAIPSALQAIAACESGGNPRAVGGGGAFRGKYQFDYGTWASVGGHGDPAAAPEPEQDRRAAVLYQREGSTPWPVCG